MAVPSTSVWEVRSTATGAAMTNGGGFDPNNGSSNTTDYSQQDNAQYGFSDLATSNGTSNPPTVTSASHTFVTADVGNFIRIVSGGTFLAGWYCINSVSGGGAVLDRACASGASTSAGVYNVGGALSLGASTDSTFASTTQPGNTIWIKNGTYTPGAALTFTNGTSTGSILIKGYNLTRGDAPTTTSRPTLNCGANSFTSGNNNSIQNIIFTGNASTLVSLSSHSRMLFCKAINNSTTASRNAILCGASVYIFATEACSYRGNAINGSTNDFIVNSCYLHDSDTGVTTAATTSAFDVINTIFDSMVTAGINNTAANTVSNTILSNTFFGGITNKTGTGVNLNTGTTACRIYNNIFYGLATGISAADANQTVNIEDFNTFNNNTTNRTNFTAGANDITSNPNFTTVAQVTGTTGVVSGSTITDSGANFSNVVDNQDFLYLISATGATAGQYLITSHTTTSVTLNTAPGGSGTNATYQVTTGRNFAVGSTMQAAGYPGTFPAALTVGYLDIGAVQRKERASTDPGVTNVRSGTTYTINDSNLIGTLDLPQTANVVTGVTFDNASKTGTYSALTLPQFIGLK